MLTKIFIVIILYMIGLLIECIYNCCFGKKRDKTLDNINNQNIHEFYNALENLTQEEFNRVMKKLNYKCC